jgi:hypothetical protein
VETTTHQISIFTVQGITFFETHLADLSEVLNKHYSTYEVHMYCTEPLPYNQNEVHIQHALNFPCKIQKLMLCIRQKLFGWLTQLRGVLAWNNIHASHEKMKHLQATVKPRLKHKRFGEWIQVSHWQMKVDM